MKTLVYFASGPYHPKYQKLKFDKIFLIDRIFRNRQKNNSNIYNIGKTTCIGVDCLESIQYLKQLNIYIDYLVILNEGLYEGGGEYALNSDMFLGYVMPLLKDPYIHIMNKNYYELQYHVKMDLPYHSQELNENDPRYISPLFFSSAEYHIGHAKVFSMNKIKDNCKTFIINNFIKLKIYHDSIWNYYDILDYLFISITNQGQEDFFYKIPKVEYVRRKSLDSIFTFCINNKFNKVGFIPWLKGRYEEFLSKLKNVKINHQLDINLFHLNKDDYSTVITTLLKNNDISS